MEKMYYVYVVFRGQRNDMTGTTDIAKFCSGTNITFKWLLDEARKEFNKMGDYGNIMVHSISQLSETLYNSLTSEI